MPDPSCRCMCKMCRAPGARHCRSHPSCLAPAPAGPAVAAPRPRDVHEIASTLRTLKERAGSHSPGISEIERALPGAVRVDACFLSNPYATDVAMSRLRELPPGRLERMVAQYPAQASVAGALLAPAVGVLDEQLVVANGACEVISALLAGTGRVLLSVPTFSAYYEFARGPVVEHPLDPASDLRLDLDRLEWLAHRHRPDTVVVINPNNPDGGLVAHDDLVSFVVRLQQHVRQVIVDESFGAFTTLDEPRSLAPLVSELPHLVVVNSLSKSHGIAGLRLGYAVASPLRARQLRRATLWNLNGFAAWFCELLADRDYTRAYESARRRYVRETRQLLAALGELHGVRVFPSAANFALLELERPAGDVAMELLARHGVYVRDCADKRGLHGDRYLRVAARSQPENRAIVAALTDVLSRPASAQREQRDARAVTA